MKNQEDETLLQLQDFFVESFDYEKKFLSIPKSHRKFMIVKTQLTNF